MEMSGLVDLDNQHLGLFDAVATARSAVANGTEFIGVLTLLSKLEDYADHHFRDEEAFMRRINCPTYDDHKQMHDEFRKYAHQQVQALVEAGEPAIEILNFAEKWLINHIAMEVTQYKSIERPSKN